MGCDRVVCLGTFGNPAKDQIAEARVQTVNEAQLAEANMGMVIMESSQVRKHIRAYCLQPN